MKRILAWLIVGLVLCGCSQTSPPTPTPTPAPTPTTAPSTFASDGITFAVPAGWRQSEAGFNLHYYRVIAYLGTGTGSMTCENYEPGMGGNCTEAIVLPPNSVVLKVAAWDGPPHRAGPIEDFLAANPTAVATTIGGLPAAVLGNAPRVAGADKATQWVLTLPGVDEGSFELTAYIRGPETADADAALSALLASVQLH